MSIICCLGKITKTCIFGLNIVGLVIIVLMLIKQFFTLNHFRKTVEGSRIEQRWWFKK